MGFFKDSLKRWFFQNNSQSAGNDVLVPVLDANGNAVGSDNINRIIARGLGEDDFVDLGLPSGTLWAKQNIGATFPTDYGWYFSWGNLEGHEEGMGYDFSQATYDSTSAAAIDSNLTIMQDAAHANWGGRWRIPTKEQTKELNDNCTSEWTNVNGVVGRLFTSTVNGNTIFFPAAGYYNGTTLTGVRAYGFYWNVSYYNASVARAFAFSGSLVDTGANHNRYDGLSVRPVI